MQSRIAGKVEGIWTLTGLELIIDPPLRHSRETIVDKKSALIANASFVVSCSMTLEGIGLGNLVRPEDRISSKNRKIDSSFRTWIHKDATSKIES
jgi:hypothetical protein